MEDGKDFTADRVPHAMAEPYWVIAECKTKRKT